MDRTSSSCHQARTRWPLHLGTFLSFALLLLLAACGSDSSTTPSTPANTGTTAVQFNMGDAPADWLLSFTMNLSSVSLTAENGDTAYVSISPVPVEMIQRLGTMEPIALAGVPKATYSSVSMSIASCTFTYLDPQTKQQVQKTLSGPFSVSIPLESAVKLDTTPYLFNFDLDLLHSLTTDDSGAFHFNPQFHHAIGQLDTTSVTASANGNGNGNGNGGSNGNGMNARYGGMYQMMGIVQSANANSLSIQSPQSAGMYHFAVNQATQFRGKIQQMSQLRAGMGVLVSAVLQSDGSLLATRVRATTGAGGAMGGGIVTWVDKLPASQLTIVMQNGAGAAINSDYLSKSLTVNLTSATQYEIDSDRVSLTGLNFTPSFDANNIFAGQSVLPFSDEAIVVNSTCDPTCGTITASTLRLREQGFRGTTNVEVTPGATTSFTLSLLPDCAFTTLTGATEIIVYQQPTTNVEDQTVIPVGTTLRVHGLLFQNAGHWVLVASTIASA